MSENKWPGPPGLIPVTDGSAKDANVIARNYLDAITVEMRIVDAVEADLSCEIFGRRFSSPIMTPAFSHLNKVGKDGKKPMVEYALAAREMDVLNWVGMEPDEEFGEILETGAPSVRIIKPFKDHDRVLSEMEYAVQHGAFAVGMDIDHVFGANGKYDVVDGIELGPVTKEDLTAYVKNAGVPFIAKGVLSVSDALKCAEAGVSGIFVSHHHGRIPYGIPPVQVLPEIRKALEGSGIAIFCDCHMDSGYDAFKALALGADAVSAGRGILPPLLKDGKEGVVKKMTRMNEELKELMGYTGFGTVSSISDDVLYLYGKKMR